MEYRRLGRTDARVGLVGLGTEYLDKVPPDDVTRVVHAALDAGANYLDLFFGHPEIRDNIGAALHGKREKVMVAGHLGSALRGDQYLKTRDSRVSETFFHDLLTRLRTDYIDVLMLHFVDLPEEFEYVFNRGPLELAKRFKQEGKARFIGMSGHNAATALAAVESGEIDVLMYPVNLVNHAMPERERLLQACVANDVGLVVMKPYAGGKLLQREGVISILGHQAGWEGTRNRSAYGLSPAQCLGYVLRQTGVSTVVPGCKNVQEVADAIHALEASPDELDLAGVALGAEAFTEGGCVYCNHCLPCPAEIDIGGVMRLIDAAEASVSEDLREAYEALHAKASDCTECGACSKRCPYEVDVVFGMKHAVQLFETAEELN